MKNLELNEVYELIKSEKDLFILDVRTKEEFRESHIVGAYSLPLGRLAISDDEIIEYEDKPVLIYCEKGFRSVQASEILENNGFSDLYHLDGGFSKFKNYGKSQELIEN